MKRATAIALIVATTLGAQPVVGEEVIRLVSHNPPFAFNEELERVIETYPDLTLSKEWYFYSQANLWVFFIADGGEVSLGELPPFAQEIYVESGSSGPSLMKFSFGNSTLEGADEITVAFFNQSFLRDENFACVSANLVVQIFNDQVIRDANSILERCAR